MKTFVIELDRHRIEVVVEDGAGRVTSDLKVDEGDDEYNAAVDGLESLLLAMACTGVDIGTPQMRSAVEGAVEAITNNF